MSKEAKKIQHINAIMDHMVAMGVDGFNAKEMGQILATGAKYAAEFWADREAEATCDCGAPSCDLHATKAAA